MAISVLEINPEEAYKQILSGRQTQIIDVREDAEYNAMHVADSVSLPLATIKQNHGLISKDGQVYLLCQSGRRAHSAAQELAQIGYNDIVVIKGGLNAWEKGGLPVKKGKSGVWSMDRQVRFTAGLLVLFGIALSTFLSSNWLLLSAVVALGMIVSAVSNTCAMANFLDLMPWNRKACAKGSKFCSNSEKAA